MFNEIYNQYNTSVEYYNLAKEYLIDDKLRSKNIIPSKQITGMKMESQLNLSIYPSMFYTFLYNTDTIQQYGTLQFIDRVPLLLCMTNISGVISGINFNFIREDIRPILLDIIYNSFESFYSNDLSNAVNNNQYLINNKLANIFINDQTRNVFLSWLDKKTGIKISNTYRIYNKNYISNIKLIEYDEWKYIPFLNFSDAIRGINLAILQETFMK